MFQKGNKYGFNTKKQNINRRGRPPKNKLISDIIKELNSIGIKRIKKFEVIQIFELLVNCSNENLNKLLIDDKIPILVKIIIKNLIKNDNIDDFSILEKMLDRIYGKMLEDNTNKENKKTNDYLLWFDNIE